MSSVKLRKFFIGKAIGIISKSIRGTQKSNGDLFTGNHVIDGIYADEDKYFIFLADNSGDIVDAISKKDIVRIFIHNPLDDGSVVPDNFN
jgi:hypothetical protein